MSGDERRTLTARQIESEGLSDWRVLFAMLHARFRTGDFATGLKLVNLVGEAAEAANHHPDIALSWNAVTVRWWTHVKRAITDSDVELARRTDELAEVH